MDPCCGTCIIPSEVEIFSRVVVKAVDLRRTCELSSPADICMYVRAIIMPEDIEGGAGI